MGGMKTAGIVMEGVELHKMKHISVPKGDIFHILHCTDDGYAGFGEAYFSEIEEGAVKGWKRHNRMALNLVVPVGAVKFVIYDDRPGSPTEGQFEEIVLSRDGEWRRLTVQPGLWMAFTGVGKGVSMLMDIIPEVHDDSEASRVDLSAIPYDFKL